jgi:hypothetical protein
VRKTIPGRCRATAIRTCDLVTFERLLAENPDLANVQIEARKGVPLTVIGVAIISGASCPRMVGARRTTQAALARPRVPPPAHPHYLVPSECADPTRSTNLTGTVTSSRNGRFSSPY